MSSSWEVQLNGDGTSSAGLTVDRLATGGLVAIWNSAGPNTPQQLLGRLLNEQGQTVGPTFQVSSSSATFGVKAAGLEGGGFVVVRSAYDEGTKARLYDATATSVADITIDPGALFASVTSLKSGGFVVSWTNGAGTNAAIATAQVFNAAGGAVGGAFNVSFASNSSIQLTGLNGGGFVAAWHEGFPTGAAKAQIYSEDQTKIGAQITLDAAGAALPKLASLANGGFVAVWHDQPTGPGPTDYDIKARIYDSLGIAVGDAFLVNTKTTEFQDYPEVAGLPDGRFVVS